MTRGMEIERSEEREEVGMKTQHAALKRIHARIELARSSFIAEPGAEATRNSGKGYLP